MQNHHDDHQWTQISTLWVLIDRPIRKLILIRNATIFLYPNCRPLIQHCIDFNVCTHKFLIQQFFTLYLQMILSKLNKYANFQWVFFFVFLRQWKETSAFATDWPVWFGPQASHTHCVQLSRKILCAWICRVTGHTHARTSHSWAL